MTRWTECDGLLWVSKKLTHKALWVEGNAIVLYVTYTREWFQLIVVVCCLCYGDGEWQTMRQRERGREQERTKRNVYLFCFELSSLSSRAKPFDILLWCSVVKLKVHGSLLSTINVTFDVRLWWCAQLMNVHASRWHLPFARDVQNREQYLCDELNHNGPPTVCSINKF